ncbi:protein B4 [Synchiropus splendidus]|uniref:protein B4 n=1 Tax=Synchiropus splendidus TaxID=270530 RepID=UPI00237E9AC7|nr:protein B4 [Synchiropus splendidus]
MPPKKAAVAEEESAQKGADTETQRKAPAHPATFVMVKEALTELDSRKGVSSIAVRTFIKQKYPTVDAVRLKHLVRKALKKGLESGAVVRPASSTVSTGVVGKFRLAPKVKAPKPKSENVDPNVPEVAKEAVKKKKKGTGAPKKPEKGSKKDKAGEDPKAPKKPKEKPAATVAPAKKPKAKAAKTEENAAAGKRKAAAPKAAGKRGKD